MLDHLNRRQRGSLALALVCALAFVGVGVLHGRWLVSLIAATVWFSLRPFFWKRA